MSLSDQREAWIGGLGELGQLVGQPDARLERREVPAVAWTEPVPELVDGPQVDACSIEREAVPVVDTGVLAEAVQEDDCGAGLFGGPVPVVGAAVVGVQEWHVQTASGHDGPAQGIHSGPSETALLVLAEQHVALVGHPVADRADERSHLGAAQRLAARDQPVGQLE